MFTCNTIAIAKQSIHPKNHFTEIAIFLTALLYIAIITNTLNPIDKINCEKPLTGNRKKLKIWYTNKTNEPTKHTKPMRRINSHFFSSRKMTAAMIWMSHLPPAMQPESIMAFMLLYNQNFCEMKTPVSITDSIKYSAAMMI